MRKEILRTSKIKCPHCGFEKKEEIPIDACVHFYVCESCKEKLKPSEGKCCVFCSYGDAKCPPKQLEENNRSKD